MFAISAKGIINGVLCYIIFQITSYIMPDFIAAKEMAVNLYMLLTSFVVALLVFVWDLRIKPTKAIVEKGGKEIYNYTKKKADPYATWHFLIISIMGVILGSGSIYAIIGFVLFSLIAIKYKKLIFGK